jgi:hypothetical protein
MIVVESFHQETLYSDRPGRRPEPRNEQFAGRIKIRQEDG